MNYTKVLFIYYSKRVNKNPFTLGNHLHRLSAISQKSVKVMSHSTLIVAEDIYDPPKKVRGMKVLDKSIIKKTITVPCLIVDNKCLGDVIKIAKKFMLKIKGLKPVQKIDSDKQRILIDIKQIKTWNDFDETIVEDFKKLNITQNSFFNVPLDLGYENWLHYELLRAILPENEPPLTSFSIIGHIVHLNIKDHLLDYKYVIAEILLDKIPTAKTVVYKQSKIDNVYRNFEMKVLCGEPNFIASVKENNCTYELDFSKVYWNPRLGTEHKRIVDILKEADVLFDVFAGIGPFSIPAAKKKCLVFANDLNPDSVKWLKHNIALNKKSEGFIEVFNQEGTDFILNVVKENLIKIYQNENFENKIHIVMNLPAIAPTFIKHFKGLISKNDLVNINVEKIINCFSIVHCYFFNAQMEHLKREFEESSGISLKNVDYSFHFIRKVSNSKSMYRVTFTLPFNYLMAETEFNESSEPLPKRICTN